MATSHLFLSICIHAAIWFGKATGEIFIAPPYTCSLVPVSGM
jgi:hypothetical protein